MKKSIIYTLSALATLGVFSACEENDWNDDLDGFEVPGIDTEGSSVTYTLTAADYTKISTKKPYTTYAETNNASDELKAVGTAGAFASDEQARTYLPMFLRDSTNNFFAMPNGSAVKVTYNSLENLPAVVQAINKGTTVYNVSNDDYIAAWGSEEDYISAYAPAAPASRFIPGILKANVADAQAGDYAVVNYNQATENPIFGSVDSGEEEEWAPTAVLGDAAVGDALDVKGYITAINARGFVLTDASGSILCYQSSGFDQTSVKIGDRVSISSSVTSYGTAMQFAISDGSYTIDGAGEYTYPTPTAYTGAMIDEAVTRTDNYLCQYVTFVGTASVSGNYYNFAVDGAAASQGSGYQVPDYIKEQITAGETYQITGYFCSVSSGKYFNVVITSVDEPGAVSGWAPTTVLADVAVGDVETVVGHVAAIDARGFVLADATGSILCYQASGFDQTSVKIGDRVTIEEAEISQYGTGLQIAITADSYTVDGNDNFTYPTPTAYTGAMMDEAVTRTDSYLCEYVTFTGTASVSGNYYNFIVDGATSSQGSGYQVPEYIKEQITSGETYTIAGYFCSVSSGKYFNVVITAVGEAGASAASLAYQAKSIVSTPSSEKCSAIYKYNGSEWAATTDADVLQPADYVAMGQSYGNLSGTQPETFLPKYLLTAYPYAAVEDEVNVAYIYYDGSASNYRASQYIYDGAQWNINNGASTSQFVKNDGFWFYNPSVVITLPYSRNTDPSYTYYMACAQWVFDNVGKELGGTSLTDSPFIDYRGNAEFWSGTSAYYGNVDVRAVTAKNNAPEGYTGYDGLTDEQITQLVEKRFLTKTMPGALAALHPDAAPVEGMEVTYTLNITLYTGATVEATCVWLVTGPGEFTYLSSTIFPDGIPTDLPE